MISLNKHAFNGTETPVFPWVRMPHSALLPSPPLSTPLPGLPPPPPLGMPLSAPSPPHLLGMPLFALPPPLPLGMFPSAPVGTLPSTPSPPFPVGMLPLDLSPPSPVSMLPSAPVGMLHPAPSPPSPMGTLPSAPSLPPPLGMLPSTPLGTLPFPSQCTGHFQMEAMDEFFTQTWSCKGPLPSLLLHSARQQLELRHIQKEQWERTSTLLHALGKGVTQLKRSGWTYRVSPTWRLQAS